MLFVHITLYTMRFKSSVLKSLDVLFTTTAIFVSHFGGGIGATLQDFIWDSELQFVDDARPVALSGLLVGWFVLTIWICVCTVFDEEESKI